MAVDGVTVPAMANNTTGYLANNESCDHGLCEEPGIMEGMETRPEAIAVPIVFALIFVVGVVGNSTLIYTVLRNKAMRNVPNIFVVSLSIGDLMLLLVSAPFSATIYTMSSWPFGLHLCKFNMYMQTLSLGVSVFTLTALSGDRYIAIVFPMAKHTGKPILVTIVTVIGIWILAGLLAIPDGYTSTVSVVEHIYEDNITHIFKFCDPYPVDFPDAYKKGHSLCKFLVFFLIPMIIIGLFYTLMARILIRSSRQMPCESTKGSAMNAQQKRQIGARLKVAKVVLSFVIIFIVCWLPRHTYLLWYRWSPDDFNLFWHTLKILSFCLTFIYSCVNPYALYFLSSQFRKYYNRYLFCCCPKQYTVLHAETNSVMYNFNSTLRRGSKTSMTAVHTQSMM